VDTAVCEVISALCAALGVDALPAADTLMIERWLGLEGASPNRLSYLIRKSAEGRRITSARYFDPIVRGAFTLVSRETKGSRPRLLSERSWPDYLAHYAMAYGVPDERQTEWLRFRWERERTILKLPLETNDAKPNPVPAIQPGSEPRFDPLPLAVGGN
jgi:hypothetical protein